MRSSGTTNVCDEKQYIIYNYHQPKTITGKSFQHFIHKQNLPPLLKVDYSFLHEISHTKAYTGLPTSGRNKMDATAHYSYVAKIDLFGDLPFQKIAELVILRICSWNLNVFKCGFYVQ